jgi:hypothetical protein
MATARSTRWDTRGFNVTYISDEDYKAWAETHKPKTAARGVTGGR